MPRLAYVLAAAVLLGGAALAQARLDDRLAPLHDDAALLYMPDAGVMKVVACGHGGPVGDIVGMRAAEYVMDQLERRPDPRLLAPLYRTLITLDPQNVDHYVMGTVFLSGATRRHAEALELLAHADGRGYLFSEDGKIIGEAERRAGHVHPEHPRMWIIQRERAIALMNGYKDVARTGQAFVWAGESSGCPDPAVFIGLGLRLVKQGKNVSEEELLRLERASWEERAQSARDALVRVAERHIRSIDARLSELHIQRARRALRERTGADARSVHELVQAGALNEMPHDPYERGFVLLPDGNVVSPARLEDDTRSHVLDRLRHYERENERPARTLEEAGLPESALPKLVDVQYDPNTGDVDVRFVQPWEEVGAA